MTPAGAGAHHDAAAALVDVRYVPYWLDGPAPEPMTALAGRAVADLAVVGGGYTGLWTALLAKEADPGRDVVLLEARTVGWAASGRNGGFCSASLTHGLRNGLDRFPGEMRTLQRLGQANLDGIEAAVSGHGIDCSFERTGELTVATAPWQADELRELPVLAESVGAKAEWLDADSVRAKLDSPTYLGGVLDADGCAMLDPARLARGLRAACLRLGVRIHENTPVQSLERSGTATELRTPYGRVTADRVALGTNAVQPPLLRRMSSLRRPGVGLRADDRAALRGAARGRRLVGPARALGRRQPVPLLPRHRRLADPLGRLRRGVPLRGPHRRPAGA